MNILEAVMQAQGGNLVGELAKNFNLDPGTAQGAIQHMLPALSKGIKNNVQKEGGLESLLGALTKGGHEKYVENPSLLGSADTVNDGNKILGHILGSKDVSRNVAGHAAKQTGIDPGILKKMLPVLATVMMGSLSKKTQNAGLLPGAGGGGGLGGGLLGGLLKNLTGQNKSGALDVLGGFLDADKDGNALDDILGMAKKFF